MCGSDYCGTCAAHAHETGLHEWAQGRLHERPAEFGDGAQERVLTRMRDRAYEEALAQGEAAEWPEFSAASVRLRTAARAGRVPNNIRDAVVADVARRMPGVAPPAYALPPRRGTSGAKRRKAVRAAAKFDRMHGGRYWRALGETVAEPSIVLALERYRAGITPTDVTLAALRSIAAHARAVEHMVG